MSSNIEYVLRTARQRGVTFVRLWYVDVLGAIKGVAFPISELEHVIDQGIGVDGSALEGGVRLSEIDVIAQPDVASFQVLPWREDANVARMFADLRNPDGSAFDGDCRAALAGVVEGAAKRGYHVQVGAELEFYLFRALADDPAMPPVPFEGGGYFDLTPVDIATDFRKRTIEFLEQLGVPVKGSYHEAGPSQQEVVLKHTDAVAAADAILSFRMAVKQASFGLGTYASFMPKPLESQPGSAMHLHLSLFDEKGDNAFHNPEDPGQLSVLGRRFTAGVLRHAAEMSAIANQWINSYKRLADGFEAPAAISWSHRHPNPLVRIPNLRPNHPDAARVELRSPDSAANPYLVLALTIAAGLRGIEEAYDLPPETEELDEGKPRLPHDLREATDLLESSALAREALGSRIVDWVVANKRREWDAYSRTVSDFERRTYLQAL